MKLPPKVRKRMEKIETELRGIREQVGELEMQKLALAQRYADLDRQKFNYWKDICAEMKLDPSSSYKIEDDGIVSQKRA